MEWERPLSQETKKFIIKTMEVDKQGVRQNSHGEDEAAWEFMSEIDSISDAVKADDATWDSVLKAASWVGHREDWLRWLRFGS